MNAHESSDYLTPLVPERVDALLASDFERALAADWVSSGSPGIEDVRGDVLERVVVCDISAPVTVAGHRRGK